LWEYRARGVVTTTLIAVIALDDALAMALYALGTGLAQIVAGQSVSLGAELGHVALELGGACVLGGGIGLVLFAVLRYLHQPEKGLALAVGALLLNIGVCAVLGLDVVMAAMVAGVTLTNLAPLRSHNLFTVVRSFATPIYVLFFVLVGARLSLGDMPGWLWGIVGIYLAGRTAGKMAGTWLGARISRAEPVVARCAGLGLFAQGGIAVGLAIMAGERLDGVPLTDDLGLGEAVVFCVTATTFLMQVVGPNLIKLSIHLAGELGRNVTEEDVVAGLKVGDVLDTAVSGIREHDPVSRVIALFTAQPHAMLPVLDAEDRLSGYIALDHLKEVFADQDTWDWLLAQDVMQPMVEITAADTPLQGALDTLRDLGAEQMLAVESAETRKFAGILDGRRVRKRVQEELVRRQHAVAA
jgi:CBS domain-containing protein